MCCNTVFSRCAIFISDFYFRIGTSARELKKHHEQQEKFRTTQKCSIFLKRIPANLLVQYDTHVEANTSNGVLVPVSQPAKRAHRLKSCHERMVFENRGPLKKLDNDLNKGSNSAQRFGHTSCVMENKENERCATHVEANACDGILVPVDAPAKRTRRFKSCIDRFVLEYRDEFQERDQNPVMQPVKNGPNPNFELDTNSSTKHDEDVRNPTPTANSSVGMCRSSVLPELIPSAERFETQKAKCSKCFSHKQNIAQLKEKIGNLEKAAILSKQSYENSLRDIKLENSRNRSEIFQQIDELQVGAANSASYGV